LSVQMRIAHVLNAIDDLIANNRRRVEVLEELARAIYRDWYLRFRYPGHEAVPLVDSGIGPIPDGWEVRTLGDVSRNLDRFRKPLSKMQRDQRRGTFPYYGAAKLLDLIDDWIFDASTSSSQRMEAWRRPWATQCCR
jgi:type I restriction enzyme, S subunit